MFIVCVMYEATASTPAFIRNPVLREYSRDRLGNFLPCAASSPPPSPPKRPIYINIFCRV